MADVVSNTEPGSGFTWSWRRARGGFVAKNALRHLLAAGLSCWSLLSPVSALASPVILEGITFSDEAGGFAILEGRGRGQPDDPFVIVEEIFDERVPAILTIRGLGRAAERLTVAGAAAGFTLVKIVRNATPLTWTSFELELREVRTRSSPYEDGLSFAQALGPQRLYRSDRFTAAFQTDEPRDVLTFHGGVVRPGETVTVELAITDYSPIFEFYLVQRQLAPVAAIHGLPFD